MDRARIAAVALSVALSACGASQDAPRKDEPPVEPPPHDPPPLEPVPAVPAWLPLQGSIEHLAIDFGPETAAIVMPAANQDWAPARQLLGGSWRDVDLQQRGQAAREHPKHSWKTRLPKDLTFEGMRTRNYVAEYVDGGYLSDPFSYGLMLAAGVVSPRWRYVTLAVNGQSQGVYVELQQVDRWFLLDHGLDPDSNVYRCGRRDCEMKLTPPAHYQGSWEKKTNESEPSGDLDAFLWELNRTPEHEFAGWAARRLDLDRLVRYLAVAILVSFSGIDDSGSYLVHDRLRDRWLFVPWDLNNSELVYWISNDPSWPARVDKTIPTYTLYDPDTLDVWAGKVARYGGPGHPPFVTLHQRIWDNPALRNRVLDEVEGMLDGVFSRTQATGRIGAIDALVRADREADPWMDGGPDGSGIPRRVHAENAAAWLEDYALRRAEWLRAHIPEERHRGEGGLVVNAIRAGEVEIYNRDARERSLAGLAITDDLRQRTRYPLPAMAVPPHGKVTVPFPTGADGGEIGIFRMDTLLPVDATYHAALDGRTYARTPDGAEAWGWR